LQQRVCLTCHLTAILVKALKNGAELNINELLQSKAGICMLTRFLVIPHEVQKLQKNIVLQKTISELGPSSRMVLKLLIWHFTHYG